MRDSRRRRLATRMVVLLTLLLAGCAESPPQSTTDKIPSVPTSRRVEASPAEKTPVRLAVADAAADSTASNAPPKKFEAPYPERSQLFQSPNARRSSAAQRNAPSNAPQVQLKGFVNLDGIRAILVFNGETNTLAAGDESAGVEVISIEPPRVTLQRGRVRWTETLR